jgi:photosystem II stability/assembly factor-like uncharacterized protein
LIISLKQLPGTLRFTLPKVHLSVLSLLLLTSCGFQPGISGSSGTQSAPSHPPTSEIHGIVSQLQMINATTGWVQSWYTDGGVIHNDILRTVDGGAHWKVMLSCLPTSSDGGKAADFVTCLNDFRTSTIATVLEPLKNNQSRIYHTSDGGQTWQSSVLNARALFSSPVFVDGQHGWFLATDHFPGPDASSSYIGQEIALFRTSDGGNSWQRVASGNAISQLPVTSDDGYGTLPPFTANARIMFTNPTTGWIIGATYHADTTSTSWLYATHDAGNTWQHVELSFSPQAMAVWTPTFFDKNNGLFPVLIGGSTAQTAIYSTYNGGKNWTQSAFVPFDVTDSIFLNMNSAWTYGTSGLEKTFYTTNDGWRHWTKHITTSTYKQLSGFSFVSSKIGWALGDNPPENFVPEPGGGRRPGDIISILKTTDGGLTWQKISHSKV